MLQRINDLPPGIDGVDAVGKITREDYEKVLKPLFEEAHRKGRRVRFLYRLGNEFECFTPGAAWEDFSLGVRYLRLFERCAVVTEKEWIRQASKIMGPLVPCAFNVFSDAQLKEAIQWLASPEPSCDVVPTLISEKNVLLIEVNGALSREDFDRLSTEIDPWIEKHHELHGLVVHMKRFPGWENLGSFFRHVEFVGEHHRKVKRVALSADGLLPEIMPQLAKHFVRAEIQHFAYGELEKAIAWAEENDKSRKSEKEGR